MFSMAIQRDTIIGDILDQDRTLAPIFLSIGMHCLGCPSSRGETVEQACLVHGVDCDELLEKLNAKIAS
jgi:hybrid cluster-associated redox disulfide protein